MTGIYHAYHFSFCEEKAEREIDREREREREREKKGRKSLFCKK